MAAKTEAGRSRDALGRRSRFVRQRTEKRLILGQRDLEILQWLYRYRYLRQTHLQALLQPVSPKRFTERLGDLFHETGLINRPSIRPPQFDARSSPMLYEITASGIECLASNGALPHRAVTFSQRSSRSYSPQFLHTMMIIETLLAIEKITQETPGQRFVPVDEILARTPQHIRQTPNPLAVPVTLEPNPKHGVIRKRRQTMLIPDALYGIEYDKDGEKRYRFWALECERTSPAWRSRSDASSTALKRAAYDALIEARTYRSHWGIPNLKLHLVSSRGR
ncbi:replication-relaxation family protein [Hoeflea sp. AS60]|uniref:replication-relaxation family protein n=1 Tax=Hoeflea sp. AS60 TaxID=3135780 RepID=UPI00316F1CD5